MDQPLIASRSSLVADHATRESNGKLRAGLAALGLYLLLALAFTWPLPMKAATATMGAGTDGWQDTWEIWWVGHAVQTGAQPFHFTTLYAPDGATDYLDALNPIETVIVLP